MDFVSMSLDFWGDMWQSRHQIMASLAQKHKVLFVSRPFSLAEVIDNLKQKNLPKSGVTHRGNNLYTLVFPKWLFEFYRYKPIRKLFAYLRHAYVRRVMKKLGFAEPVLLVWNPRFVGSVGSFDESLCCYYVDDEFSSYAGLTDADRQLVLKQEDDLLRHADLGFANGRALLELKNRYGNLINVPMCADFELFSKSRLPETKIPEDLQSIPHPRIGLVGNINDKIDLHLLLELSTACSNYSFVLIGPAGIRTPETQAAFESLKKLPNVFWLGFKQRELLPNYIKGLDVCLMCYRTDGWAYYVYPLKLHEYLASGKPTIGSGLVSLKEFDGVIRVAETPAQWLDAVREAVADHDPVRAQERIDVARANRLEERVKLIEATIEQKLAEKRSRSKVQFKPSA